MRKTNRLKPRIFLSLAGLCLLFSCSKSSLNEKVSSTSSTPVQTHVYGLLPVSDEEMKDIPLFNPEMLNGGTTVNGLSYSGTLPSSYLMTTPAIRDQGQIGSCTGFCGTEANEILKYYAKNGVTAAQPVINSTSSAIAAVNANKFSSPTSFFGTSGALAPLFLYYVERVKIERGSLSSDPGANMVNIGQALQGLTSNSGSGRSISPYGESTEDLYPYPTTLNSQGYNIAGPSSKQFRTAPGSGAISNAANFKIAKEGGSTTASGSTTAGYYYIAGTGDVNEVNNCKYAILNNKPVLMGFTVYDNSSYSVFEGLNTTSYVYNPLTNGSITKGLSALGGHAVPLVGYFDDGTASTSATGGGYFIVQNSWGTPWGYHGHFLLPYAVLRNSSVVGNNNLFVLVQ
jgi:Papain family cysteine protease